MPAEALRLEVASIADQNHWRWVLKEANGAFLADHELALNPLSRNTGLCSICQAICTTSRRRTNAR